jgi:hypothetical protein
VPVSWRPKRLRLGGQRATTACNRVGSAQTVRVEAPRISVHASSATHMRAVRMVYVWACTCAERS